MEPPRFFLVSYDPLVSSAAGREASKKHKLPPFIDGSIRREPDLAHKYPSISCLCRARGFAPRLRVGDFVAYMTNKGTFGLHEPQRRLTAVLQVHRVFQSHKDAAAWYIKEKRLPLPINCWVNGNYPMPLDYTHRRSGVNSCASDAQTLRQWDAVYQKRADDNGDFVVCRKLWRNLTWKAPNVSERDLVKTIGFKPQSTRTPPARKVAGLLRLMRHLRIPVPRSIV